MPNVPLNTVPLKQPPNLLVVSMALAIAYWLFESCMHAYVWQTGPIGVTLLAQSEKGELEMRTVIVMLLIGSGWFGQRLVAHQYTAAQTIARLNRLLSFTSFISQNVTRRMNLSSLFDDVCKAAVNIGGFHFAWIGQYDADRKTLEAVATASFSEACLKEVEAAGLRKNAAHCPMALAAATGQTPTTCLSLKSDSCRAAWRDTMLEHGCNSAAAFPLHIEELNVGALVVYSGDEGFFHDEELNILAEAAGDLSYTLTKIKVNQEREKSTDMLRQRVEELERFQHAAITRELRVKELKDEVERLRAKNDSEKE
ncbi:MAG TPA: GAF domain-containing protein [Mariprofundaceae bacterium]|nr:GAF domain-containing protein [Mariprofundaceae bacterium]